MKRPVLSVFCVACLFAVCPHWASGQYYGYGPGPLGEPITQGLLQVNAEGQVTLTKSVWKDVNYQYTKNREVSETVEVNGEAVIKKKLVPETYTATRRVSVGVTMEIPESETELFDTAGKGVKLDSVRARLARPTLILITEDGKLHPSFSGLFKQDALVLSYSPRPLAPPAGTTPLPVPQPAPQPAPPAAPAEEQTSRKPPPVLLVGQQTKKGTGQPAAEAKSPFPKSLAPTFRYCQLQEKGNVVAVRHFFEAKVTTTAMKTVVHEGVKKLVPFQLQKTIGTDETIPWDRKMVKFLTVDGQPMDAATVMTTLSREVAVVAAADGQPVDTFWLQNINPSATVIVLPQFNTPQPQAPTPLRTPTLPAPAVGPPPAAVKQG